MQKVYTWGSVGGLVGNFVGGVVGTLVGCGWLQGEEEKQPHWEGIIKWGKDNITVSVQILPEEWEAS